MEAAAITFNKPSQVGRSVAPLDLGYGFSDHRDFQAPADVAIVMPTVLRPVIVRAIESVYQQDFQGRIQILIGVDKPLGSMEPVWNILSRRPSNISALVLNLPYSTSIRHGGVHAAMDGGSLRTILSFMANSKAVAYLDDDNILMPDHIRLFLRLCRAKPFHSLSAFWWMNARMQTLL